APGDGRAAFAERGDLVAVLPGELLQELVSHLREEVPDRGHAVPARQDRELEIVAQPDAVARRDRNELHLVRDPLETLAGLDPLGRVRGRLGGDEHPSGRKTLQAPARGEVREAGDVVEVAMRDADGLEPDDVLGRPPELEERAESRKFVE